MRGFILFCLVIGLSMITSCDDIIEKKLTGKTVSILSPPNGGTLPTSAVTLWWNEVAGATKYNIQVVRPSFSNIQFLILDSMVSGDKYVLSLQPGAYEWRIKALNFSTETIFFTFSFSVDSSLNLSNQSIQLLSPVNNYISNQLSHTFSWSPVFYADDYRFEILSSTGNTVYVDAALDNTTVSYTFANDGNYTWRVRAQNNSSVSLYSQASLVIDLIPPPTPIPLSPANNSTVTNPFTLTWSQATDNGAAIFDSLYIFADLNEDTLITAIRPVTTSYTDSLALGDYFWKLTAIDSVGNYSPYTNLLKFTIQ